MSPAEIIERATDEGVLLALSPSAVDRKFERTLAMLLKLKDLRGA